MLSCDLCGTEVENWHSGSQLKGWAQHEDIKYLCRPCLDDLEAAIQEVDKAFHKIHGPVRLRARLAFFWKRRASRSPDA